MEELPRLQASRRGHKAHLTKLLKKANDILQSETQADEMALTTLKTSLEQLERKRDLLRGLDEKIAAKLIEPDDLEAEILESEVLCCELEEKLGHIRKYIELSVPQSTQFTQASQPSTSSSLAVNQNATPESPPAPVNTIVGTNDSTLAHQNPTDNTTNTDPPPNSQQPPIVTGSNSTQNMCRLPKLSLPMFSGNPFNWQSFWDSFDAAVHGNPSLNGIQRFNYLKAQLKGDALQAIAGFPLTSSNYEQAVNLLKDRFGQPHKIVNAHMQALLDILTPG